LTKILVYGTLRQGFGANRALKDATFVRETRVPGFDMINLGGFPGIVPNPQNKEGVVGEVYDNVSDNVIEHLDHYEGYRPDNPKRSYYLREKINVEGDEMFVYVWNQPADLSWYQSIPTGDWKDR
jgi:gamma-glutamylcyclotransferase (GGCT)/AIG2-like uncharacterized protein YtfP